MKTYINTKEIRNLANNLQYCLSSIESATDSLNIGRISSKAYKKNNFYNDYSRIRNSFNVLYIKISRAISVLRYVCNIYENSDICIESTEKTSSFIASLSNISIATTEGLSTTSINEKDEMNYFEMIDKGFEYGNLATGVADKLISSNDSSNTDTLVSYLKDFWKCLTASDSQEKAEAWVQLSKDSADILKIFEENKGAKNQVLTLLSGFLGSLGYLISAKGKSLEDILLHPEEAGTEAFSLVEAIFSVSGTEEEALMEMIGDAKIAVGGGIGAYSICSNLVQEYVNALSDGSMTWFELGNSYLNTGINAGAVLLRFYTGGLISIDTDSIKQAFAKNIENVQSIINESDLPLWEKIFIATISTPVITINSTIDGLIGNKNANFIHGITRINDVLNKNNILPVELKIQKENSSSDNKKIYFQQVNT